MERKFSWGICDYKGCHCPLIEAGFTLDDDQHHLVDIYDELMFHHANKTIGVADEEKVQEEWKKATEEMVKRLEDSQKFDQKDIIKVRHLSLRVQKNLGWLENSDSGE